MIETFITILETDEWNEDGLHGLVLEAFGEISHWYGWESILNSRNGEILLGLLPPAIPEHRLPEHTEKVLRFYQSISGRLAHHYQYFNALLLRQLNYLYDPIHIEEGNFEVVTQCLMEYFINLDENNPIVLENVVQVLQRLLQLKELVSAAHHVIIFDLIMGIIITPHDQEQEKAFFETRIKILESVEGMLDRQLSHNDTGHLLLCCCTTVRENAELIGRALSLDKLLNIWEVFLSTESLEEPYPVDVAAPLMQFCVVCPRKGMNFFLNRRLVGPLLKIVANLTNDFDCESVLLEGLLAILGEADTLVDDMETLYNPIALQIDEAGSLDILVNATSGPALKIREIYFGEVWQNYLARRRGMKTKKALC